MMGKTYRNNGLFLCLWLSAVAAQATETWTVGVVPQFDPRRIQAIWQPILQAVTEESDIKLTLKGSPGIPEFEKAFEQGDFDFAYMNPYHLIVANQAQGYLPLVRDTGHKLYGIIVVRKDSPLQSVADLNGKIVAFPAPNALGAALIPRAEFKRKFQIAIQPHYVRSHSSTYLNVILKQADAGGGVQKTLEQQKPEIQAALRVLYQTDSVAPHPLAAHPRVPPDVRNKVQNALLALGKSETGRSLLAEIPVKEIGVAVMADYEPLQALGLEAFYVKE